MACIGISPGAGAGKIVEIAAGTYAESITNNLPSGTSWSAPFTLRARSGDVVTIRANAQSNVYIYLPTSLAFFSIIQGFIFDGINLTGTQMFFGSCCDAPSSIRVIGNELINTNRENAIYIGSQSMDIQIINNKIHGGSFTTTSNGIGRNHAIYLTGSNSLIEGNELYDLPAYGIHQYSEHTPLPSNNVVRRNKVHDFAKQACCAAGILLTSGPGSTAYNNLVYNGAVGIVVGASTTAYNNTVYNQSYVGIDAAKGTNSVVRNNIAYQNSNNMWTTASGVFSNNLTVDPKFMNAAGGDFRLQSTSSAIDGGAALSEVVDDIVGTKRPMGRAYDIGAHESQ
jgi:hypothetical protein